MFAAFREEKAHHDVDEARNTLLLALSSGSRLMRHDVGRTMAIGDGDRATMVVVMVAVVIVIVVVVMLIVAVMIMVMFVNVLVVVVMVVVMVMVASGKTFIPLQDRERRLLVLHICVRISQELLAVYTHHRTVKLLGDDHGFPLEEPRPRRDLLQGVRRARRLLLGRAREVLLHRERVDRGQRGENKGHSEGRRASVDGNHDYRRIRVVEFVEIVKREANQPRIVMCVKKRDLGDHQDLYLQEGQLLS